MEKEHTYQKKELELKNEKLLSLFTTLSPNPVFRFDKSGNILMSNTAGDAILKSFDHKCVNIFGPLKNLTEYNLTDIIQNELEISITSKINEREYEVIIKGIADLEFGHAYCFDITDRLKFESQLIEKQNKLRELAFNIQDINENTRNQIAMELHDGVCQTLNLVLSKCDRIYGFENSEEISQISKEDYKPTVQGILTEIKSLSYQLSPKYLLHFGLFKAIERLVKDISSKKIKGNFLCCEEIPVIDEKLEINIYRICQEILNNIVKHSNAKEFNVQFFSSKDKISIVIDDDGVGFDVNNDREKTGLGLFNIYERINYINGHIEISSSPDRGTNIVIDVPTREIKVKYE